MNRRPVARLLVALVASVLAAGLCCALRGAHAAIADEEPCWVRGSSHAVRCGEVLRPAQVSSQFAVRYIRIPARARLARPDPIVFLVPGPDVTALASTEFAQVLFDRARSRRDVVLLEGVDMAALQRPCGVSSGQDSLAAHIEPARQLAAFQRCADQSGEPSAMRARLATDLAVSNLEALRSALRAPRLNLFAKARGAAVARAYAARHPDRVRVLALDDMPLLADSVGAARVATAALTALIQRCLNDPDCASMHAGLSRRLTAVLSAPARRVTLVHPVTGRTEHVLLDGDAVRGLLLRILHDAEDRAALPAAVSSAWAGDYRGLVGLASLNWPEMRHGRIPYLSHLALCDGSDLAPAAGDQDPWGLVRYARGMHAQRCHGLRAAGDTAGQSASAGAQGTALTGWLAAATGLRLQCLANVVHRLVEHPAYKPDVAICGMDSVTPAWPMVRERDA